MTIQDKIMQLRKKFNMTRTEIASFVGVSERTIFHWEERGKKAHRVFEKKVDELINMNRVKEIARG